MVRFGLAALSLVVVGSITGPALGQTPIAFQYFYDDLNQLSKVVDSTGVVIEYVYDAVGNMVQIKRSLVGPGVLTIFGVTPQTVGTGGTVTIQGQGFSITSGANVVMIGGVAATVVSATTTTLVLLIPGNATSGIISITVGGTTVSTSNSETVIPLPTILSVIPRAALGGTSFSLAVTGMNLSGATFSFASSGLNATSAIINAAGTTATLTVTAAASVTKGYYALIGTNAAGPSSSAPKVNFLSTPASWNALTIPGSSPDADPDSDGLTNAQEISAGTDPLNGDTDGDGWPDGLEAFFHSNPLDPKSVPHPNQSIGWVSSPLLSMFNDSNPSGTITHSTQYVSSPVFSALNNVNPSIGTRGTMGYISGGIFSILNSVSPAPTTPTSMTFASPFFSILNGTTSLPSLLANGTLALRTAQPWSFLAGSLHLLDSDGDGISDEDEIRLGTNPFDPDTDHDGYPDGLEIALGSNPLDPKSVPNINLPGFATSPSVLIQNYASVIAAIPAARPIYLRRTQ